MELIKLQQAILFSTLIITSSLAGCFGNDEENPEVSNYENDITEKDKEIENLEAAIANLTMSITDLTTEIASMEDQYSLLMMSYNSSVLQSENLSSQLIYCEMFVYPETPICLNAQGWYAEYMVREEAEQNLTYALEEIEWMESHLVAHLIGVNLSGADLSFADLSDSVILDSNLSGADLRMSFLNNSNLSGTDFSYAQLDYVTLGIFANLTNTSFRGVNLGNVQFDWHISLHGIDFTYSNGLAYGADGATFVNSDLTGATYAVPYNAYWINTLCPDGSNSDNNGNTCEGHEI